MTCSTKLDLSPQLSPQGDAKVTQELRVPIGDNVEGHAIRDGSLTRTRPVFNGYGY